MRRNVIAFSSPSSEAQADLATLPTVERQLQLREADANVADATYGTVAKELKDAELTSIAAPEARLISPAMVPQTPSKPRHDLMGGLSLLCGLMVGSVWPFSSNTSTERRAG